MIADIREAFERERRFTANVAHELRTPVSEMRSLAEVALRYQTDLDAQNRKNYEDILASAKEMQATVLNLLTLARCDSGKLQPEKERIPLEPLVSSTWREFADAAASKAIRVHHEVSADTSITTDEALFRLILKNLFSNAVRYTNEGGEIEWKTVVDEDNFSFSLSNSTENLSGHDISCIFEPFWQKDKARTSGDAHSGLGLSLVQSLAALLGLQVSARLTTPTHLTVTLSGKITPTA
jgi:two-component system sensor histidine kinase QseC